MLFPLLAVLTIVGFAGGLGVIFILVETSTPLEEWGVIVIGLALVVGVPAIAAFAQRLVGEIADAGALLVGRIGKRLRSKVGHRKVSGYVALATGLMLVGLSACASTDEPLLGTVLTTSDPAPPFRLHDHFGQQVALSDFDGRVVLLTFLYTYCQDVCPMVAGHLRGDISSTGRRCRAGCLRGHQCRPRPGTPSRGPTSIRRNGTCRTSGLS